MTNKNNKNNGYNFYETITQPVFKYDKKSIFQPISKREQKKPKKYINVTLNKPQVKII